MNHQQETEAYFKACGWVWLSPHTADERDGYYGWVDPNGVEHPNGLPNITESMTAFNKWVTERMEETHWFALNRTKVDDGFHYMAVWHPWITKSKIVKSGELAYEEPIKENEILLAGVIAARKYLQESN